ncbi:YtxH domain-containing protein [bacterium]|nr:YtxH domain-containing protein [bacterium]
MEKRCGESLGFFLGLLAGTAIGVSLGMILAPHSGEENRRIINDKTSEYKAMMNEKFAEYRQKASQAASNLQNSAREYFNRPESSFEGDVVVGSASEATGVEIPAEEKA